MLATAVRLVVGRTSKRHVYEYDPSTLLLRDLISPRFVVCANCFSRFRQKRDSGTKQIPNILIKCLRTWDIFIEADCSQSRSSLRHKTTLFCYPESPPRSGCRCLNPSPASPPHTQHSPTLTPPTPLHRAAPHHTQALLLFLKR